MQQQFRKKVTEFYGMLELVASFGKPATFMNTSFGISKPCSEDWNRMSTAEQGRHCQVCCKTVVDFSERSNEEIVKVLSTGKKICGRFRKEQLQPHVENKPLKRYRVFFAALLFAFGGLLFTSCSTTKPKEHMLMGDVAYVPGSTQNTYAPDTLQNHILPALNPEQQLIPVPDTLKRTGALKKVQVDTAMVEPSTYMLGEVMLVTDTVK